MCLNADGWESLMKTLLENGEMTYVIGSQPSEVSMGKECKGDTKIQVESDIEMSILGQGEGEDNGCGWKVTVRHGEGKLRKYSSDDFSLL